MIIYNFVTGKRYNNDITQELEKICIEKGYKTGLFATGNQIKNNTNLIMRKGSHGYKVTMYINHRQTYFTVFNIEQLVYVDEISRNKYNSDLYILPPKDVTDTEYTELEKTLAHFDVLRTKDNQIVDCFMTKPEDKKESYAKEFVYQEYLQRKQAKLAELEKVVSDIDKNTSENDWFSACIEQFESHIPVSSESDYCY